MGVVAQCSTGEVEVRRSQVQSQSKLHRMAWFQPLSKREVYLTFSSVDFGVLEAQEQGILEAFQMAKQISPSSWKPFHYEAIDVDIKHYDLITSQEPAPNTPSTREPED